MRCNICDKPLSEGEIIYIKDDKSFEPCGTCLDVALEAAYSGDFHREEPLEDAELEALYGSGIVELLDYADTMFDYKVDDGEHKKGRYEEEPDNE